MEKLLYKKFHEDILFLGYYKSSWKDIIYPSTIKSLLYIKNDTFFYRRLLKIK